MNDIHQQFTDSFANDLALLNPEQKRAVDHLDGPVLVIAGPGTGKTQILATRIGQILSTTDTDAYNILCLTYTDTGRVEMRNRLFRFMGPGAYRIQIHTFHSFCNEVIQDHLSYFGKLNLEAISELEEIALYRDLVDSIEPDNPLKRFKGDVYYDVPRLRNLFSRMKKEAWSPEFIHQRIDQYLEELPTRDAFVYKRKQNGFNKGDPHPVRIREETDRMEKLKAAVDLYPRYVRLMEEAGRYTFDDMILWVLDAFSDNQDMLLDYQERFLYFMVDEFQDTSGSQNKLLQYLTGYWDPPNVFVVGDDDQSIFSFQDANVENIRKFAQRYEGSLCKIVLTENYRSTQPILDTARVLIEHNLERIINDDPSLNKNLVAASDLRKDISVTPLIIEYPSPVQETVCIADKITALLETGIRPGEIAVIYRNHKLAEGLADCLEKMKIPVSMKRSVNLLELPFVRNILHILEYTALENEIPYSGDELLFEMLHYEFFRIPAIDIAKISVAVSQNNYSSTREKYSIRRAISEQVAPQPDLFTEPEVREMKAASDILERLIKKRNNLTLQELVEEVIREAGVLRYVMQSPEKIWLLQVLNSLFEFVKSETKKNPDMGVRELMDTVRLMNDNRLPIPLQKTDFTDEGVHLVTAHGAKGAQFGHVFLMSCTENIWDKKNNQSGNYFKLPDNLYDGIDVSGELEESRRLFYVAITRAETYLEISYPTRDVNGKDLVRSTFVSEILSGAGIEITAAQAAQGQLVDYLSMQFTARAIPEIELIDSNYIDRLLKKYTLSVTHLNNYLSCPIKFYYQNLIRVPAAKSASMTFGSAVHFALQRLFEKMKKEGGVFPPMEVMMNDFSWYMHRNRESFTREEFTLRMAYAGKVLPAYYDHYLNGWVKSVEVEWNVRNVEVRGVPLNGKMDKIEKGPDGVNVVDYKTGKYENAKVKLRPPGDKAPLGGDYWRQAVFYKILLDNDRQAAFRVLSTEFDFVEPVKKEYKTERIDITQGDIDVVTAQITDVWARIQAHEFSQGCGKEDCHWCNFVKENKFHVALHELLDEEEAPGV